jgi:hypothetical protein
MTAGNPQLNRLNSCPVLSGEVSERLKEQHWKCCKRVTVSGVRIPPSPLHLTPRLQPLFFQWFATGGSLFLRAESPAETPFCPGDSPRNSRSLPLFHCCCRPTPGHRCSVPSQASSILKAIFTDSTKCVDINQLDPFVSDLVVPLNSAVHASFYPPFVVASDGVNHVAKHSHMKLR